jgi:D-hexose-6-phosphate mutarotase
MTAPSSQTGRVTFLEGRGELPMLEIVTPWSTAEVYLHGAHVTHFQKNGEPPLLFMSQVSRFLRDAPIRGGIPVIFPWFGKPVDKPLQHGIARVRNWEVKELASPADGSVTVKLRLPYCSDLPACAVEYVVTVSRTLRAELVVTNKSEKEFAFENCLHTYFTVGDIGSVSVTGLKGVKYLDQLDSLARKVEKENRIHISSEVDRVYVDTKHTVSVHDASLKRIIRVEKEGSASTVVWNPWIAKAKAMQDFGDEEYQKMICVESGNVNGNAVKLAPGKTVSLRIKLSSTGLKKT